MTASGDRERIVVGVDGTPWNGQALRWAVDQARRTGADVEAVLAWEVPLWSHLNLAATDSDFVERHQQVLDKAVSESVGDVTDVTVTKRLIEQAPSPALVSAAKGAQLLVVAAKNEGVLPGMHLGSVANFVVHHAPCPVLVFRGDGAPHAGLGR